MFVSQSSTVRQGYFIRIQGVNWNVQDVNNVTTANEYKKDHIFELRRKI